MVQQDQVQGALQAAIKAVEQPIKKLADLPHRDEAVKPPKSLAEALAAVVSRDEEKKRKESKREYKGKGRSSTLLPGQPHAFPGTVPGHDREITAFWLLMEVRCGPRCRHVARQLHLQCTICSIESYTSATTCNSCCVLHLAA